MGVSIEHLLAYLPQVLVAQVNVPLRGPHIGMTGDQLGSAQVAGLSYDARDCSVECGSTGVGRSDEQSPAGRRGIALRKEGNHPQCTPSFVRMQIRASGGGSKQNEGFASTPGLSKA